VNARPAGASELEFVIRPRRGWQPLDLQEIWRYRELLGFLVWRDVKIRYRQTVLGGLWAVLQPLLAMVIFTVFFHRLGGMPSAGPPYALFVFVGLVPWMFFANAVTLAGASLVGNPQLISKIYFPRVFVPLSSIGALVVDLALNLLAAALLLLYFRWRLTAAVAWLPVFVAGAFLAAIGLGLILAALNAHYRDVKYAAPFLVQMGLFVTPVIYPLGEVPAQFQLAAAVNPMAGVVEGFRHALLGTPVRGELVAVSLAVGVLLFIVGLYVFRRMELRLADVI
jgi:lipopolysaccharide transport system permease protein